MHLLSKRPYPYKYLIIAVALFAFCACYADDPLPSWNEGPAKQAIVDFIQKTTDKSDPAFVPPDERLATFDQDGTLWVEHPINAQFTYCLHRLPIVVAEKPELKNSEPFKTLLSQKDMEPKKLPFSDFCNVIDATLTGMPTEAFQTEVKEWIATARHKRWNQLYTNLTYQPMQEVLKYFRNNGYKTYIVTAGNQDFIRAYSEQAYGIPPEQIVGTMTEVKFTHDQQGRPILIKEPKFLLGDNYDGKPEGIHLMIGRRPYAAFGNTTGDEKMLEFTSAGKGMRLAMLVLHDDPIREYAYGPAQGLPDTTVGTFPQTLYDKAKKSGWTVISMKNDWKRIFSFDDSKASNIK